jgi:hypothetical protein
MTFNIREDEVHTIELVMTFMDNRTTLEALERFILKLRERGFGPLDSVILTSATINQRSQISAKRSVKHDPKPIVNIEPHQQNR